MRPVARDPAADRENAQPLRRRNVLRVTVQVLIGIKRWIRLVDRAEDVKIGTALGLRAGLVHHAAHGPCADIESHFGVSECRNIDRYLLEVRAF